MSGVLHMVHSLCVVARTSLRDVTACSLLNSVRHPYGSGSLQSEPRSGGLYQFIHSRLMCIQSCFRASNLYAFWSLHRLHCRELLFMHKRRPCAGKAPAAGPDGKKDPRCPSDPESELLAPQHDHSSQSSLNNLQTYPAALCLRPWVAPSRPHFGVLV